MYNRGGKQKGIQTFNVYFVFFLHMFFSKIYKIHKSNINVCEKDKLLVNCYSCYTMWRQWCTMYGTVVFLFILAMFPSSAIQWWIGRLVVAAMVSMCLSPSHDSYSDGFSTKIGTTIKCILWMTQCRIVCNVYSILVPLVMSSNRR